LVLFSCGNGVNTAVHYVDSVEDLDRIAGKPSQGYAEWGYDAFGKWCDIYLLSPELYRDESFYHETYGHEARHCDEGDWHEE
jgi:hypothetical protein